MQYNSTYMIRDEDLSPESLGPNYSLHLSVRVDHDRVLGGSDCLVRRLTEKSFFKLNISKCKVEMIPGGARAAVPQCEVDGCVLPVGDVAKCLGYWWRGDLLATNSVEEIVKRARVPLWLYWSLPG